MVNQILEVANFRLAWLPREVTYSIFSSTPNAPLLISIKIIWEQRFVSLKQLLIGLEP